MLRERIAGLFGQEDGYEEGYLKNVKSIEISQTTGTATVTKEDGKKVTVHGIHALIKSGTLNNVTFGYFYLDSEKWTVEFQHGHLGTLAKKGNKLIIELTYKTGYK